MSTWTPSFWGKVFGGGGDWILVVEADGYRVTQDSADTLFPWDRNTPVLIGDSGWWPTVTVQSDPVRVLKGLPKAKTAELRAELTRSRGTWHEDQRLRSEFDTVAGAIDQWYRGLSAAMQALDERWLTREFVQQWVARRPKPSARFLQVYKVPRFAAFLKARPEGTAEAIDWWRADLQQRIDERNERFLTAEARRYATFFRTVESSPLTGEQIRSVVCFDNRVQVVAAAGSGKTSTMIAKAGYTLHKKILPGEQILMLAFNAKAADELRDRVVRRLGRSGLTADTVTAKTFHAFGRFVIGQATGRMPRLARGLEEGNGERLVEQIVDRLRDRSPAFRAEWDLFRIVFGRTLPPFGEEAVPEEWDPDSGRRGYRTMGGEVVKSQEERMIADWLYYHGVDYVYEADYAHRTADPNHGQYRPDFYYPGIDTYHEHWALNSAGRPPPHFKDYLAGVRWKKQTHAANRTTLLETTSATVRDGTGFEYLAEELTRRGIVLDEHPYRDPVGRAPISDADMIRLMRTFMIHVKSNRLSEPDLDGRAVQVPGSSSFRTRAFLRIFDRVYRAWNEQLAATDEIDFEDMLNLAADHIEAGRWTSPYRLVMVDEMQDASRARSRLARALVAATDRYLFAVGDDWQSINRFAGADLSSMTGFHDWFGPGPVVKLQQTFRSPQSICDLTSRFITANPNQMRKQVRSSQPEHPPAFRAVAVRHHRETPAIVDRHLRELSAEIAGGRVPPGPDGPASVYILGRYRRTRDDVRPVLDRDYPHLKVGFSTIHAAKGREADYVVLPGLTRGGLPSTVEDDPLLELAMPAGDDYPHAEERRLFYVALTRARRSVLMTTVLGRESPFLIELLNAGDLELESATGEPIRITPCPKCGAGRLIEKSGPYGKFLGCNNFPRCDGKASLPVNTTPQRRRG